MAKHHMITGEVNRRGYLKYVILLVSVRAAERVQRATELPLSRGNRITRATQKPGAKRWVQRLDRAQTGVMGSCRTVFLRPGAVD
jgi:hypothetical protein